MLIDLTKSQLFTLDPDIRFSKEYGVPKGTWAELWRRYKLLDYTQKELRDYLFIKNGRHVSHPTIIRWIRRTEIYSKSNPMLKKGVKCVNSSFFDNYEQEVINILTKNLYSGASKDTKAII